MTAEPTGFAHTDSNTLKVCVDQLNKAVGNAIVNHNSETVEAAKIARMVVHGGIEVIVGQRDALLEACETVVACIDQGVPVTATALNGLVDACLRSAIARSRA